MKNLFTKADNPINIALNIFSKFKQRIFGLNFWVFYALVLVLCIVQNGIWHSGQTPSFLLISKDIFSNPFINNPLAGQQLLSSFLGPLLAYLTSMNDSIFSYCLMHFGIFLLFFTLLTKAIKNRYGDFIARSFSIIFFLSPISNVLFTWLGTPDILTVLLSMMIVVFNNNLFVLFIGAFLMGVNHPEQGLVIFFLLTTFNLITRNKKETVIFALIGIGSLLMSRLLLQWYFNIYNFNIVFERLNYTSNSGILRFIEAHSSNPFALVFSLYNISILFVCTYILYFWKKEKIAFAFVLYSMLAFLVMLIVLDQTRVFSILTFPALLLLLVAPSFQNLGHTEKEFFKNILSISFLVGLLIPRFVVWDGNVYYSSYKSLFSYLYHLFF